MKLKKFFLPMVAILLLAVGCRPDPIVPRVEASYYDIQPYQWQVNAGETFYYVECNCPQITKSVIEQGIINVYYIDQYGYDNQLPYVLPYYNDDNELFWENLRYDVGEGKVTFILQESDLYTGMALSRTAKFKVATVSPR